MKKLLTLTIISVLALTMLLCGCSVGNYTYENANEYKVVDNSSIDAVIKNLDIDYVSGDVSIAFHSEDTILITEEVGKDTKEADRARYYFDGSTLFVKYRESGTYHNSLKDWVESGKTVKKLTVTLPESLRLELATVELSSGSITADKLNAAKVDMDASSGSIKVTALSAADIDIEISSGSIDLVAVGETGEIETEATSGTTTVTVENTAQSLDAESSSGKIIVNANEIKEVELNNTSGNLSLEFAVAPEMLKTDSTSGNTVITLPANAEFTADVDLTSGEFICAFPTVRDGIKYTCGSGTAQLFLSATSGDITIEK